MKECHNQQILTLVGVVGNVVNSVLVGLSKSSVTFVTISLADFHILNGNSERG